MTITHFWNTIRDGDDDIAITVEFSISGGCEAHMGSLNYPGHPAESPEVEIVDAWLKADEHMADPPRLTLTDAEDYRITIEILEGFEDEGPDYDDDWRD